MPKTKQTDEDSEIQVKLKPFAGIRPGVYLVILYSLVLLFIMFFFLFLPGIKNYGSMLIVKSEPSGAAIRVNDIYMGLSAGSFAGLSGSKIFVPKGTHNIDVVMPGFKTQSDVIKIDGRVFASLFFPKIKKVEYTLKPADLSADGIAATFALYAADFASWTFAGEPTVAWQVPMSLSEGAYRIGPYTAEAKDELNEILKAAAGFAVTKAALRDIIRAKVLLDGRGSSPSPLTLLGSMKDALVFISENPEGAKVIFDLLPRESVKLITDSNWYKKTASPRTGEETRIPFRQFSVLGLNFINTTFASLADVMICATPVPPSLFETFLNENPEYREHKTDYYPDEIASLPEMDRNSVTGVTWYAAKAFCEWLSLRVTLPNMEVRLPTENESILTAYYNGIYRGPGWEWCADPYAPLKINASQKAIETVGSPERALFGIASQTQIKRASLPPDLSSPFVTFRPVIAPKE